MHNHARYFHTNYAWYVQRRIMHKNFLVSKMAEGTQIVTSFSLHRYSDRFETGDGHRLKHGLEIKDGFVCETAGRLSFREVTKQPSYISTHIFQQLKGTQVYSQTLGRSLLN